MQTVVSPPKWGEMGITVDNVITIDPVSRISCPNPNRDRGTQYHNIYVPATSRTKSIDDKIARIGRPWVFWAKADSNHEVTKIDTHHSGVGGHMGILVSDETIKIISSIFN